MNAFSFGLSSAIVVRQSSVSFSDVILPAATFGAISLMVVMLRPPARVTERRAVRDIGVVVERGRRSGRRIIPVGGAQLRGRLRQAVERGNQIGQAALFGVGLGERQPLSYRHVRFTETETPSPTCRNDV